MGAVVFLGAAMCVAAQVWFLVVAFTTSVVWGFLCLLIPGAALIFTILNWERAKGPFCLSLVGGLVYLSGLAGMPASERPRRYG